MPFGNFFENIQVFVACMGHNWLRTMKGQKRTKNETLVDLIQTFSFFNSFLFSFLVGGERLDPSSRVCNANFQLISVGNTPRGPITFNWK